MGARVPLPLAKKSQTQRSRTIAPAMATMLAPAEERLSSGTRTWSAALSMRKGT